MRKLIRRAKWIIEDVQIGLDEGVIKMNKPVSYCASFVCWGGFFYLAAKWYVNLFWYLVLFVGWFILCVSITNIVLWLRLQYKERP